MILLRVADHPRLGNESFYSEQISPDSAQVSGVFCGPVEPLFVLQRVCKTFQTSIRNSIHLRRRMFLAPYPAGSPDMESCSPLHWLQLRLREHSDHPFRYSAHSGLPPYAPSPILHILPWNSEDQWRFEQEEGHGPAADTTAKCKAFYRCPEASWRRIKLDCVSDCGWEQFKCLIAREYDLVVYVKEGNDITLGRLYDLLQKVLPYMLELHELCNGPPDYEELELLIDRLTEDSDTMAKVLSDRPWFIDTGLTDFRKVRLA